MTIATIFLVTLCATNSPNCNGPLPKPEVEVQLISSQGCEPDYSGRPSGSFSVKDCYTPYTLVWRLDGQEITRQQVDPTAGGNNTGSSMTVKAKI